jgi:hypothetical protein
MFQFPAFAALARYAVFNCMGSPIRKSPDQFLFADPRSLSQLTTSFITSGSLGILRSLFFSFSFVNLRAALISEPALKLLPILLIRLKL